MAAQVYGADGTWDRVGTQRWEYVRVQIDMQTIIKSDETLAGLGEAGWELACAVETDSYVHFWLKREVQR